MNIIYWCSYCYKKCLNRWCFLRLTIHPRLEYLSRNFPYRSNDKLLTCLVHACIHSAKNQYISLDIYFSSIKWSLVSERIQFHYDLYWNSLFHWINLIWTSLNRRCCCWGHAIFPSHLLGRFWINLCIFKFNPSHDRHCFRIIHGKKF